MVHKVELFIHSISPPCPRFDPEFACNASDRRRRYTYEAQPYVCRWNLVRLAEALGKELQGSQAGTILDDYMPMYERFYMANMRKKLGLLQHEEPQDQELVEDLLETMHNTGIRTKSVRVRQTHHEHLWIT